MRPHPAHRTDPVPEGAASGGVGAAKEVHALVEWAFTERSRAICRGWNKMPIEFVRGPLSLLGAWLRSYPVPSPHTQRRLLKEMWHHVVAVMPRTAAGRKKLDRLHHLLKQA